MNRRSTNKLKRRGYILFSVTGRTSVQSFDICSSKKELNRKWYNELDDKWDLKGRNKIHFFYLDIATGRYIPLKKWVNDFSPSRGYDQCKLMTYSSRTF